MTLRAWLRLFAAGLILGFCYAGFSIARLWGSEMRWVQRFLHAIGYLLGLRVTIEGHPGRSHVLYVANHISWLDILAVGGATQVRFIAKDDIAGWPMVGALARLAGTIFVSRERRAATRIQADTVLDALKGGRPVMLFAEGGIGDGSIVRPFRPALFASAVEAAMPVQPVAIDYGPGRMDYAWPPNTSFSQEAKRMLNRAGTVPVALRFLSPLDAHTLDRKALAIRSQAAIADALT